MRDHISSQKGVLRSLFHAKDSSAIQVDEAALELFLRLKDSASAGSFAARFGFLGLYEVLQLFQNDLKPKQNVFGEPLDAWMWHAERVRTLEWMLNLEFKKVGRGDRKRLRHLLEPGVAPQNAGLYSLLQEADDRGPEHPALGKLLESDLDIPRLAKRLVRETLPKLTTVEFKEHELILSPTCLLGHLYLSLAKRHGLFVRSGARYGLCRICRETMRMGKRGPERLLCKKCRYAVGNHGYSGAVELRAKRAESSNAAIGDQELLEVVSRYRESFGDRLGTKQAILALKRGLGPAKRS